MLSVNRVGFPSDLLSPSSRRAWVEIPALQPVGQRVDKPHVGEDKTVPLLLAFPLPVVIRVFLHISAPRQEKSTITPPSSGRGERVRCMVTAVPFPGAEETFTLSIKDCITEKPRPERSPSGSVV